MYKSGLCYALAHDSSPFTLIASSHQGLSLFVFFFLIPLVVCLLFGCITCVRLLSRSEIMVFPRRRISIFYSIILIFWQFFMFMCVCVSKLAMSCLSIIGPSLCVCACVCAPDMSSTTPENFQLNNMTENEFHAPSYQKRLCCATLLHFNFLFFIAALHHHCHHFLCAPLASHRPIFSRSTDDGNDENEKVEEKMRIIKETKTSRPPSPSISVERGTTLSSLEHTPLLSMHIHRFYDVPNGNYQASENFQTATIYFFSFS